MKAFPCASNAVSSMDKGLYNGFFILSGTNAFEVQAVSYICRFAGGACDGILGRPKRAFFVAFELSSEP